MKIHIFVEHDSFNLRKSFNPELLEIKLSLESSKTLSSATTFTIDSVIFANVDNKNLSKIANAMSNAKCAMSFEIEDVVTRDKIVIGMLGPYGEVATVRTMCLDQDNDARQPRLIQLPKDGFCQAVFQLT